MAKQPSAGQPVNGLINRVNQKHLFFILLIGLALLALLSLGLSQLSTAHAQSAPQNVDFGSATVGTQGQTKDVTFSNTISSTVNVNATKSGMADFVVLDNGCIDVNV